MDSFFDKEEEYVSKDFDLKYETGSRLLRRLLKLIEELIRSSGFRNDQYPEYSIALHVVHSLMALNNSLQLLRKGYMGDCEAVHKRAVEFFLRAVYFREFPEEERKWREEKPISDRRKMAMRLDERHKSKVIFPTDSSTFFNKFLYDAIYSTVNEWAHGDFKRMYQEAAIENGSTYYASKLYMGPKLDEEFAKRMLRRLANSCIMHVLFLAQTLKLPREKYHDLVTEGVEYIGDQR